MVVVVLDRRCFSGQVTQLDRALRASRIECYIEYLFLIVVYPFC